MHAGHDISRRFAQPVPKARLGRQQGWSWGLPQRSPFTDCTRIISMSRGKEGLAQGCLLQAVKQGFRACISYPDFLFPVAHPRDLLSLSLHRPPPLVPVSLSSLSRQPSPSSSSGSEAARQWWQLIMKCHVGLFPFISSHTAQQSSPVPFGNRGKEVSVQHQLLLW